MGTSEMRGRKACPWTHWSVQCYSVDHPSGASCGTSGLQRRTVGKSAARRGEDLQDPFHAALAAGWAHRRKRAIQLNLTLFPLTLALIAAQIWGNCLGEHGDASTSPRL